MSGDAIETAPDGSEVVRLARVKGGSMARFVFAPGSLSRAVRHRRVEELWYVLAGQAELWCQPSDQQAEVVALRPGSSIAIAPRCAFQVRVAGAEPLRIVAVTMPPWPGDEEAEFVPGHWDKVDED